MTTANCASCSATIDPTTASYSEEGRLICKACEARQTIQTGDKRAADAIFGAGIASLVLGIMSLGCNPGFIMTISAIGSGASALFTMMRHPEYRATLGEGKWMVAGVSAVLGLLLGLVIPGLFTLGLMIALIFGR